MVISPNLSVMHKKTSSKVSVDSDINHISAVFFFAILDFRRNPYLWTNTSYAQLKDQIKHLVINSISTDINMVFVYFIHYLITATNHTLNQA